MASITIRKLDDSVKAKLRIRAAQNGRSMEEEARSILETEIAHPSFSSSAKPRNFYESIRRSLTEAGVSGIELQLPPRGPMREPPDYSGPEYGPNDDE